MTDCLAARVIRAIRSVVGPESSPLHEPVFAGNEWQYLKECIDTGNVASQGRFLEIFEDQIQAVTGAGHVVAVASGTAALHIALKLADVGEGDEVLVPALTFVATANAVTYCGAVPHFVECEDRTLGIDAELLKHHLANNTEMRDGRCINRHTGRVIKALVPVHVFGHPADLDGLCDLARNFCISVVEDAAEGLGSLFRGRHLGTFGLAGVLSFNGNKIITTGNGGAILTDCATIADQARHIATTAKVSHRWEYKHDQVGYNYRLPNMNAALGCAQIEQLPELVKAKRNLYGKYLAAFQQVAEVELLAEPSKAKSNYWLQAIRLRNGSAQDFNKILEVGNDLGYQLRPIWTPLHQLIAFSECPRASLSTAENLGQSIINLPSTPHLGSI